MTSMQPFPTSPHASHPRTQPSRPIDDGKSDGPNEAFMSQETITLPPTLTDEQLAMLLS